jgi:putative pyruvate formate lyase activating enzyme
MKKAQPPLRSVPKQSDIIIQPDGKVSISFLWDDYGDASIPIRELLFDPPKISTDAELGTHDSYSSCQMCPKECGFNRIKAPHPRCGDEKIQLGTWGITFGDEPEIVGKGGSGAILFSHCPLHCPSCHNPEMVSKGYKISLNEIIEICYKLYADGAENIQFLSPTVHMAKLELILRALKGNQFPLPIVFKSSGAENIQFLKRLEGLVDIYLPDFKYGSNSQFAKRARVPHYFEEAKETIKEMVRQVGTPRMNSDGTMVNGVLIRHVMAPLPLEERTEILNFFNSLGNSCKISVTDNFVNLE